MPAKSKAQQRLMGMAHAIQTGELSPSVSPAAAKIARTMKPGDVEEFASTKLKGLPEKKNPEKKRPKRQGNPGPPKPPGETMSKPSPNPELGPPLPPAPPSPPEAPPAKPAKNAKPTTIKMPAGAKPPKPPPTPKRTMGGILSDLRRARRTR